METSDVHKESSPETGWDAGMFEATGVEERGTGHNFGAVDAADQHERCTVDVSFLPIWDVDVFVVLKPKDPVGHLRLVEVMEEHPFSNCGG